MSSTMGSAIDPILPQLRRGVEGLYSEAELRAKLATGRPLRVKLGLDPTAPDIHLGHTVVLRKLRQFQDLGHKAVLIIGDYTARIGDPSGRDTTRPVLDGDAIAANARTYMEQAGRIVDTSPERFELCCNSAWLAKLTFADTLRLTGQVTVQQMLHRENFATRLAEGREIAVSEFMYPLMQGYDSVAIRADVELGGSDQTFNCLIARDLMARYGLERQVVITMPILAGLDGHDKMSKSKGNYIGVTESPDEMFGKVMSIPDSLMPNYYQLLTDLPAERLHSLLDPAVTHPREAKDVLGRIIVEDFHGPAQAEAASAEFRRRFSEHQLPSDLEVKTVAQSPVNIVNLVVGVGFAASNTEARRLLAQGGVTVNQTKVTDAKAMIQITGELVLKVGKRRVCQVRLAV